MRMVFFQYKNWNVKKITFNFAFVKIYKQYLIIYITEMGLCNAKKEK
jgi:hypothetical protein